jgi:hypothetical protein
MKQERTVGNAQDYNKVYRISLLDCLPSDSSYGFVKLLFVSPLFSSPAHTNLFSPSQLCITFITDKLLYWGLGRVERMGEMRNAHTILVRKPEKKTLKN